MSDRIATVNVDTEFKVPHDCPTEGEVRCRVVDSDCEVIDTFDGFITFRIWLKVKLMIRRGGLACRFFEEISFTESLWQDGPGKVIGCEVDAVGCRCVVRRGKVRCAIALSVRFCRGRPQPVCPVVPQCPPVVVVPVILPVVLLPGRLW